MPRTGACDAFFRAFFEQVRFLAFIGELSEGADRTARAAADALLRTGLTKDEEERSQLKKQLERGAGASEQLHEFEPMVRQIVLSRSVDNFLCYVSDLIALIFQTIPESFRPPDNVQWEEIAKYRGGRVDDLIASLIDRRVTSLSQEGLYELVRYLKKTFSFDLFPEETAYLRARLIVEQRNLVVHRRGIIDRHFLERVPGASGKPGDALDPGDVWGHMEFLAWSVIEIEERAGKQFGLPKAVANPRSPFES